MRKLKRELLLALSKKVTSECFATLNASITAEAVVIVSACFYYLLDIIAKTNYTQISYNVHGGVIMLTATATEIQNNFGKYLQAVQFGNEIIIIKNGREVARLISKEQAVSFLSDKLTGVLKNDYDAKAVRAERLAKYEGTD